MNREVQLTRRARRDVKKLDTGMQRRVVTALERFATTEHGDVKKLTDVDPAEWRLRVGDLRVFFTFAADTILVLRVLPRGEAYR